MVSINTQSFLKALNEIILEDTGVTAKAYSDEDGLLNYGDILQFEGENGNVITLNIENYGSNKTPFWSDNLSYFANDLNDILDVCISHPNHRQLSLSANEQGAFIAFCKVSDNSTGLRPNYEVSVIELGNSAIGDTYTNHTTSDTKTNNQFARSKILRRTYLRFQPVQNFIENTR